MQIYTGTDFQTVAGMEDFYEKTMLRKIDGTVCKLRS